MIGNRAAARLPGTGKTLTYLRCLIVGRIRKRWLFSRLLRQGTCEPGFIDPGGKPEYRALIIEDAENIIMDRRFVADHQYPKSPEYLRRTAGYGAPEYRLIRRSTVR